MFKTNDIGCDSAIVDIRAIAARYERPEEELPAFAFSSMEERLVPMLPEVSSTDVWKRAALALMLMLGLSASALAVQLNSTSVRTRTLQVYDLPLEAKPIQKNVGKEAPLRREPTSPPSQMPPVSQVRQVQVTSAPAKRTSRAQPRTRRILKRPSADFGSDVIDLGTVMSKKRVLPYRLTRREINSSMGSVNAQVATCFANAGYRGTSIISISIATTGKVNTFGMPSAPPAMASCVEKRIRNIQFPPLRQPFSLRYPFALR